MSLKSAPYYWVECDFPGCGERPDYGDYAAWADSEFARDNLDDWLLDVDGTGQDYCPEHNEWDDELDERVAKASA